MLEREPELAARAKAILDEELAHFQVSRRDARAAVGAAVGRASWRESVYVWAPTTGPEKAVVATARAMRRIMRAEELSIAGPGFTVEGVVTELLR